MTIRKASRQIALNRARAVNPALFDRVMSHVDATAVEACWPWQLQKDRDGYGVLKVDGKNQKAHRISHALFNPNNELPLVRHLCHNPACVNPIHLRGGTPKDNAIDRKTALRAGNVSGILNGRSKLSEQQVYEIRSSAATGADLAKRFKVSKVLVCSIRRGAAWTHI